MPRHLRTVVPLLLVISAGGLCAHQLTHHSRRLRKTAEQVHIASVATPLTIFVPRPTPPIAVSRSAPISTTTTMPSTTTTNPPATTTSTVLHHAYISYGGSWCKDSPTLTARVEQWRSVVAQYSWPVQTMMYHICHESGGDPGAINSSSGACGLFQLLPCPSGGLNGYYNIHYAYYEKYEPACKAGDCMSPWGS